MTPDKAGTENSDLNGVIRNYRCLFVVADACECSMPTSARLTAAFALLDKTYDGKLTGFPDKKTRNSWYRYEGEKLHDLLAHINRHFQNKRLRHIDCRNTWVTCLQTIQDARPHREVAAVGVVDCQAPMLDVRKHDGDGKLAAREPPRVDH